MAEYQTIRVCGPDLRRAFQNDLLSLADDLHAVGLISDDNLAEITNLNQPEPNRASRLLEFIRNKVKLSATHYYTFLEVLKGDEYKHILKILGEHTTEQSIGAQPISTQQQQAAMNTGTGRRYYERDHAEIIGTLKDYAAHWRAIGAALGFKEGELDNIQANLVLLTQSPPLSYLRQMVSQWLQWAPRDGRGSTGFATEESLHVALLKANLGAGLAVQVGTTPDPSGDAAAMLQDPRAQKGGTGEQSSHAQTGARVRPDNDEQTETPEYDKNFVKNIKKTIGITGEMEEVIRKLGFFEDDVVIILVVNKEEFRAACHHMKPIGRDNISSLIKYTPSMTLGTFGGCNAVLVRTDMGGNCQGNVKKALEKFPKAKAIIAVGVAYGASRKYAFGDVLVSSEIHGFSNVRLNDDGTVDARDPMLIHPSQFQKDVIDAFTLDTDNWDSLKSTKEGREAEVHTGPIASVPLLLDSMTARDAIVKQVSKMIGGEMEGYELLKIQRELHECREIGVIVVKGISDFADGDKDKRWQLTAAMAAASYVDKVISDNHRLFKPKDFQSAEQ